MFDILSYDFFIRAIIAALLISIACGVIGTYIVSKRIVFIGGGISHSAFGGIGIAYYFQLNPIAGAAIFAVAVSIVIEYMRKKTRMPIDSLIGIIWSLGMAIGILFVHITPGTAPNLMSYLFGSIYVISYWYLVIMAVLCFTIILFFTLFFKEILYIAFDENYAVTQEIPVRLLNFVLMALLALTLVINQNRWCHTGIIHGNDSTGYCKAVYPKLSIYNIYVHNIRLYCRDKRPGGHELPKLSPGSSDYFNISQHIFIT